MSLAIWPDYDDDGEENDRIVIGDTDGEALLSTCGSGPATIGATRIGGTAGITLRLTDSKGRRYLCTVMEEPS